MLLVRYFNPLNISVPSIHPLRQKNVWRNRIWKWVRHGRLRLKKRQGEPFVEVPRLDHAHGWQKLLVEQIEVVGMFSNESGIANVLRIRSRRLIQRFIGH